MSSVVSLFEALLCTVNAQAHPRNRILFLFGRWSKAGGMCPRLLGNFRLKLLRASRGFSAPLFMLRRHRFIEETEARAPPVSDTSIRGQQLCFKT